VRVGASRLDQLRTLLVKVSTGHSGKNETDRQLRAHTLAAFNFSGKCLGDQNLTLTRRLTKSGNLAAFERRSSQPVSEFAFVRGRLVS
jgi:hypothetical protein